jgi:hypothetical protein
MTQRAVAASVRVDRSWVSRFERGKAEGITIAHASMLLAVVGLDLSLRAYPSDDKVRDEGQVRLIARFLALLPDVVGRALEVPFPLLGDRRAWDVRLRVGASAWGVEAESHMRDLQATLRSSHLKERDGQVAGVVLLLAGTRHHRALLREHGALIRANFPVDGRVALEQLMSGRLPSGNAVILL